MFNIPVQASEADPDGTEAVRAFHDLRRIKTCPLEELLINDPTSENKCAKHIRRDIEKVRKLNSLMDIENGAKLESEFKTRINRFVEVAPKLRKLLPGYRDGKKITERLERLDEKNNAEESSQPSDKGDIQTKQLAAQFFNLVEIFKVLNDNPWIKRAYWYGRFLVPEQGEHHKLIRCGTLAPDLRTSPLMKAWYIIFPMVLFFLSFGFQSFMLHLATHFYIMYMDNEQGDNERQENGGQLLDVVGNFVAKYLAENGDSTGEGAVYAGNIQVPTILLDATAAIPLLFCVVAYCLAMWKKTFNIGLWNRTFLVASAMAILKGIFDVVTILPDSTGWQNCTERLQEEGLRSLRDLNFLSDFWGSLFTQLLHEVRGGGGKNGGRVRYCADMMVSGHTYFACLFSMSAYKQIAYNTEIFPSRVNKYIRNTVLYFCFLCVMLEMLLVAAARFHYTVDMLASVVLVFLLFDSRYLEQVAADWSEGFEWHCKESFTAKNSLRDWMAFCTCSKRKGGAREVVIPSQSECFNYRRTAGHSLSTELGDEVDAITKHCDIASPKHFHSEQSPKHFEEDSKPLLVAAVTTTTPVDYGSSV